SDGVLRCGAGRDHLGAPPAGWRARGGGRRVSGGPALPASGPWRARILAWASSARWQAWASAFPLTRPFARRASRRVFDLCAGFVYSQVLLAVVRLRLLEQLTDGPRSAEELATALDLPADSTDRLLS